MTGKEQSDGGMNLTPIIYDAQWKWSLSTSWGWLHKHNNHLDVTSLLFLMNNGGLAAAITYSISPIHSVDTQSCGYYWCVKIGHKSLSQSLIAFWFFPDINTLSINTKPITRLIWKICAAGFLALVSRGGWAAISGDSFFSEFQNPGVSVVFLERNERMSLTLTPAIN